MALAHIDHWIFDLDNTLYAAETNLFGLIDIRMGEFIGKLLNVDADEARRIQKSYFYSHGTTLAGLMQNHAVDPHDFLEYVHDIALDRVSPSAGLRAAIESLPGHTYLFTNADAAYAQRVLARLGLDHLFERIHDIHAADYKPKPMDHAYTTLIERFGIDPERALFVEDMARNLEPAKRMGMTTVWLNNGSEGGDHASHPGYIDHEITARGGTGASLESWLSAMTGKDNP